MRAASPEGTSHDRVDVAQVGMIAMRSFSSRPLRDAEQIGGSPDLLMITTLPPRFAAGCEELPWIRARVLTARSVTQPPLPPLASAALQRPSRNIRAEQPRAVAVALPHTPAIVHARL